LLLRNALGASSTAGTNPYTHTYTLAQNLLTGLTWEVNRGNSVTSEIFTGCKINKMTITADTSRPTVEITLDILGRTSSRGSISSYVATTNDAPVLFHQLGDITWNSVTYANMGRRLTIELDNQLAPRNNLGSQFTQEPPRPNYITTTVSLEMEDQDDNLYTAYHAGTQSDLNFTFTSGSRSLAVSLQNARIMEYKDPISSVGVMGRNVVFRGLDNGTNRGLSLVMINTLASASL
jgi:hypothetical protein